MLKQMDTTTWSPDFPSWMPDWTAYHDYISWLGRQGEPGLVAYGAGGEADRITVLQSGNVLAVQGFIFNRIDRLGQDHITRGLGNRNYEPKRIGLQSPINTCIAEPIEMLRDSSIYGTPPEMQQVAASTFMVGRIPPEPQMSNFYETCYSIGKTTFDVMFGGTTPEEIAELDPRNSDDMYWRELYSRMQDVTPCLRLCKTEAGRLGQVPHGSESDDVAAIFVGSDVPYILRCDSDAYRVVGAC